MTTLKEDIQAAINCHSAENASNTPDFILAQYLEQCLTAFDAAVEEREWWHGRKTTHPTQPTPESETGSQEPESAGEQANA